GAEIETGGGEDGRSAGGGRGGGRVGELRLQRADGIEVNLHLGFVVRPQVLRERGQLAPDVVEHALAAGEQGVHLRRRHRGAREQAVEQLVGIGLRRVGGVR